MSCPSCGAANAETARFCNMCGSPLDPLAVTQRGLSVDAARAVAEASATRPPVLSVTTSGSAADAALAATRAQHAAEGASGVGGHAAGAAPSAGTTGLPAGFDPSTSLALESLGIRTPRRLWGTVGAVAAACIGVGVLASRWLTPTPEPHGTAAPTDPFVIGAPTAEVDYVSGSAIPNAALLPGETPESTPGGAQTRPGTQGSPSSPGTTPVPPASSPTPGTTPVPAGGPTPPPSPSAPPTSDPAPPTPSDPVPPATPTAPTEPTAPTAPTEATPAAEDPAMALDLYAARVRYLVRRYHGAEAQRCFDDAIARSPSLSGQVLLQVPIDAQGVVGTATVGRNTTGDDALGRCLASRASSWTLAPPPGGAVTLSFPFSR